MSGIGKMRPLSCAAERLGARFQRLRPTLRADSERKANFDASRLLLDIDGKLLGGVVYARDGSFEPRRENSSTPFYRLEQPTSLPARRSSVFAGRISIRQPQFISAMLRSRRAARELQLGIGPFRRVPSIWG